MYIPGWNRPPVQVDYTFTRTIILPQSTVLTIAKSRSVQAPCACWVRQGAPWMWVMGGWVCYCLRLQRRMRSGRNRMTTWRKWKVRRVHMFGTIVWLIYYIVNVLTCRLSSPGYDICLYVVYSFQEGLCSFKNLIQHMWDLVFGHAWNNEFARCVLMHLYFT